MKDQHVVIYNQQDRQINIKTAEEFIEKRNELFYSGNQYVYTDLFKGSEDECIKFCSVHKLKVS